MKKTIVFLLLIIFIGGLLSPFSASAGQYKDEDGNLIIYKGLVPCGKTSIVSGESSLVKEQCQFCHLFVMVDAIVHYFLLYILGPIIVLMILVAGIMFYFAGGNPNLLVQAKALITSVVIGVVIILCSFLIVGTVLNVMGVSETNPLSGWAEDGIFVIKCPIEGPSSDSTNNVVVDENGYENGDDGIYSDPNTSGDLVTKTKECEESDEIAIGGECSPVDANKTIIVDNRVSSDGKGYTCEFRGALKNTSAQIDVFYSPEVTISVICVDDPNYVSPTGTGQEATIRKLEEVGVKVNNPCVNENCNNSIADCGEGADENTSVCVDGLPDDIINKLGQIKEAYNDDVVITGGTETFGHSDNTPHGDGEAIVDLRKSSGLEDWLKDEENSYEGGPSWCSDYGTGYVLKDGSAWFCDEGDHFHFELQ